jgi:hypothetical protein
MVKLWSQDVGFRRLQGDGLIERHDMFMISTAVTRRAASDLTGALSKVREPRMRSLQRAAEALHRLRCPERTFRTAV